MSPLGLVAEIGVVANVIALTRRPGRGRRVWLQFAASTLSFGLLWFATASSFATRGMVNLPIHMIGHIIVMFVVPIGLVLGGTARSWWWLLPVAPRRRYLRWFYRRNRRHLPVFLRHPLTAALALNVVMVSSHLPAVFDWVMYRQWAMDLLMEPAFLLSGLYFFHFIVKASPRKNRERVRWQFVMIAVTMMEMLFVAMAMAIFSKTSWYSSMQPTAMEAMPGMRIPGMALNAVDAFHQQQLAAGILWICGDFWAVPSLVVLIRRFAGENGGLLAAFERQFSSEDLSAVS